MNFSITPSLFDGYGSFNKSKYDWVSKSETIESASIFSLAN